MKIGKSIQNKIASIVGPAIFDYKYAPIEVSNLVSGNTQTDVMQTVWAKQMQQAEGMSAANVGYPTSPLSVDVAKYYVAAYTGHAPDFSVYAENRGTEMVDLSRGNYTTMKVQVDIDAGAAMREAENWEDSEQVQEYVDVRVGRVSRAFSATMNEVANGLILTGKIAAAAHAVILAYAQKGYDEINVGVNAGDVGLVESPGLANFDQKWVKDNLSTALGVYDMVDATLLDYDHYMRVLPDSTFNWSRERGEVFPNLGLGRVNWASAVHTASRPNTGLKFMHTLTTAGAAADYVPTITQPYGKVSYPTGVEGHAVGLITQRRAMQFCPFTPLIHSVNQLSVSSLGVFPGVGELLLKAWIQPGQEKMWFSVEGAVGYKMTVPGAMKVVTDQLPT